MKSIGVTLFVIVLALICLSFDVEAQEDKTLLLTPLIKAGKLEEARAASQDNIKLLSSQLNVVSYSGYLTLDDAKQSNLFFWFFPAEVKPESAPVLLWLKDYPGFTSLKGLFLENGPFSVDEKLTLQERPTSWTKVSSMLYIDVPVGSGFSFATNKEPSEYSTFTEEQDEIYKALTQFFTLFSDYEQQDFYLAGMADATFLVPYLTSRIETGNAGSSVQINLKGAIMGSPWLNIDHVLSYSSFAFSLGLIDESQSLEIDKLAKEAFQEFVADGNYKKGMEKYFQIIGGKNTLFEKYTGFSDLASALISRRPDEYKWFTSFVNSDVFRTYLHAGEHRFIETDFYAYEYNQPEPFLNHSKAFGEMLDKGYRVLFYIPQFDLLIPPIGSLRSIETMPWSLSDVYAKASRKIWRVKDDVAGYVKQAGNFSVVFLRNAGYRSNMDQPQWTFDMLQRFLFNKSF